MARTSDGVVIDSNLHASAAIDALRESNRNFNIQLGQIVSVYYIDDGRNLSKRMVEYDVTVSGPRGSLVTYRNVKSTDDLGDGNNFTEAVLQNSTDKGQANKDPLASGAWVIVASLNGRSESMVILKAIQHPGYRRKGRPVVPALDNKSSSVDDALKALPTKLPGAKKEDGQRMLGEFVGVRWNINKDGELTILVQGPKDDKGALTKDVGQVIKFNKDGEILFLDRLDQELLISPKSKSIRLSDGNGDQIVISRETKTITLTAGGDIDQQADGNWTVLVGGNALIEATGNVEVKGAIITMNGVAMGDVLTTVTSPVVDSIFGQASIGVPTVKAG